MTKLRCVYLLQVSAGLLVLLACFIVYRLLYWPIIGSSPLPDRPVLIAHGGGNVQGVRMSNSLEALDANYSKGFRFFELDFSWTPSRELVAIHDWNASFHRHYGKDTKRPDSAEMFIQLKTISGLTPLDIPTIRRWLQEHSDAVLVTDVKQENVAALQLLSRLLKPCLNQIIPQIYEPEEYESVASFGFQRIIYTIYRSRRNIYQVIQAATEYPFYAITVPAARINRFGLARRLRRLGMPVYAHTINDLDTAKAMAQVGVFGFYTDSLPHNQKTLLRQSDK